MKAANKLYRYLKQEIDMTSRTIGLCWVFFLEKVYNKRLVYFIEM